jgi:flagellar operon protein
MEATMSLNDIQRSVLLSQLNKVDPAGRAQTPNSQKIEKPLEGASFDEVLGNQYGRTSSIQFSKHAAKRLQSRQIEMTPSDQAKLENAFGSLEKKGARDSLVLMGDKAFIVNVPSKTVVTALSKEQMKEQVFTNIDSTMLVNS